MSIPDPLAFPYSDNDRLTVGARLTAEIEADPSRLDVASGYFSPSVWGALGSALDRLSEFRLLIGKDHELDRLSPREESAQLDLLVRNAIAGETQPQGLINRGEAEQVASLIRFLEAHRDRQTGEVVKLWRGSGFLHAKAYILNGSVGIGSANFTAPGLHSNRELVGWRQDRDVVAKVRDWFDGYWDHPDSVPYTDELIRVLAATPLVSDHYTPYEVLIRTLAERYGTEPPESLRSARLKLHWFQEDAVQRVTRLLEGPAHGALLADAVGLGKTYMAMGVIHHYLYRRAERRGEGRPVLLIIPAALEDTWRRALDQANLAWACELLTTQRLRGDFNPADHAGADLVVIDEAHRLRGGGTWFRKAVDLVSAGEDAIDRRVLLLTATPVNTGMQDLVNLLRVMTKNNRGAWAPEIADFERHLARVEKHGADPFPILDRALVRRSRGDVLAAWENARAAGQMLSPVKLPKRRTEHIDYRYEQADGDLFTDFATTLRSLSLAPYHLDRFRGPAPDVPPPTIPGPGMPVLDTPAFPPGSLAALLAAGLLTRFQSSLPAIRASLRRLDAVLHRFDEALRMDPPRLLDLKDSPRVRQLLRDEATGDDRDDEEPLDPEAEDGLADTQLEQAWQDVLDTASPLSDPDEYRLDEIRAALAADRDLVGGLLSRLPDDQHDGKFDALLTALRTDRPNRKGAPALAGGRTLIFSQFRDTARYLHARLTEHEAQIGRAALIDGGTPTKDRTRIAAFFDPNRSAQPELAARSEGADAPRLLISTDVLAEGHNLQLADTVINFDLHFNPQVAVQRAGRVDRLGSPHATVRLVSMLPPENLDQHIGLLARLDERFRRIHGLGLGDESVTPLPADIQGRTLEQMRRLYADDATVLDEIERSWTFGSTDYMRAALTAFLSTAARERLREIPVGVASVKSLPDDWQHGEGVFIAMAEPSPRHGAQRETYWRFYPRQADGEYGDPLTDDVEIFRAISCRDSEPRAELPSTPEGPGVFDWDLISRAARELAATLNMQRAQAEIRRGATERSRRIRSELRADATDTPRLDALLDRLLQVAVEDYDARTGARAFDEARRRLKRARTTGERQEATVETVERGLALLGEPEDQDATAGTSTVAPEDIRLVAYEALVTGPHTPAAAGEQLPIAPGAHA